MVKTLMGIIQEVKAVITKNIIIVSMMLMAIDGNHLSDHQFLTFYAIHKLFQS